MPAAFPELLATAPSGSRVTDYDVSITPVYLLLFDLDRAGASWQEAAREIGLDPTAVGARRTWRSHLNRARWMAKAGFRQLMPESGGSSES